MRPNIIFILKPQVQCIGSNGEEVLMQNCSPENGDQEILTIIRKTYCADSWSCVVENDNGNGCKQFGYCVEEKPITKIIV